MRMVVQKKKKNVCVQEMMQNRNWLFVIIFRLGDYGPIFGYKYCMKIYIMYIIP